MSVLRSTCLLGRFAGAIHSQSLRIPSTQIRCVTLKVTHGQTVAQKSFEERNADAHRPMSPHLTIYAPQLTSMMSISYRVSGMVLSAYYVALAGASFMTSDVAQVAQSITALGIPTAVLFPLKFMLALPATYHIFNGIRHLAWDTGRFFTLKSVYTGGYATLAATFISAFYLAM
ncbi:uncharacterized protein [Halyomorpha halys]|uniref:uncharacterized protein n=1 Tax=Halyomorpha halys TaxID=286706 RepID=UPI0006D51F75|nr:succinate dehydrogenase cytochrome B subunit, mitochondrial [Halyomorpha halys]